MLFQTGIIYFLGAEGNEAHLNAPVSEDEASFAHPLFSPETPSSYYLAERLRKFGSWTPPGGFK